MSFINTFISEVDIMSKLTSVKLNDDDVKKMREVKSTFGMSQQAQVKNGLEIVRRAVNAPCMVTETQTMKDWLGFVMQLEYQSGALASHLLTLGYVNEQRKALSEKEFNEWFEAHYNEQNAALSQLMVDKSLPIGGAIPWIEAAYQYHKKESQAAVDNFIDKNTIRVREQ